MSSPKLYGALAAALVLGSAPLAHAGAPITKTAASPAATGAAARYLVTNPTPDCSPPSHSLAVQWLRRLAH